MYIIIISSFHKCFFSALPCPITTMATKGMSCVHSLGNKLVFIVSFLRNPPIDISRRRSQHKKGPKQLVLVPTSLIQILYLDCTIADQCSTFLLFFNQKNWWTIFEGGEFSLGLTGIRSCAIQQANPAKISSWV
jgi:hypothetical protein